MTEEIKPCPFCNSTLNPFDEARDFPRVWDHPKNDCCLSQVTFRDMPEWNRRVLPQVKVVLWQPDADTPGAWIGFATEEDRRKAYELLRGADGTMPPHTR